MKPQSAGKLRIGDHWNAIRIIALSQSNPLKAVAEFVENSIDARARQITVTRGRERGEHFLRVKDDGEGIRQTEEGRPDFEYVATHICDSIKRHLKAEGAQGLQGEFGIGLLSFWTVGEELVLTSVGRDGSTWQMHMRSGDPGYQITRKHLLMPATGTELLIRRILPGIKQLSGEKIQWYLASELRDRIRASGVEIRVVDRTARAEYKVEPRQFDGRLLHEIRRICPPELYLELYLSRVSSENVVGLYRQGTRVLENLASLEPFQKSPWTNGYLQGLVDASYLNLTPGTRTGVIHDAAFERLARDLGQVEPELVRLIDEQQRAEEEQTSRDVLRSVQRALKEALLALPQEEYDWFDLQQSRGSRAKPTAVEGNGNGGAGDESVFVPGELHDDAGPPQKDFFQFAGPLFSVRVSPASSVLHVGASRKLRALARDRSNRAVETAQIEWSIVEGTGAFSATQGEFVEFTAGNEPGLTRLRVRARQEEIECFGEGLVTVTESLLPEIQPSGTEVRAGIPAYTFQRAPGELWRSRYETENNLVVINNGHRDFVYASRNRTLKLRYICRLYAKELVLKNFAGTTPDQLLERLIELSLYTEENLK